jgi:putative transposase
MVDYRKGSHTIYDIKYHVIWKTKYRYKVLSGKIAERLRELIRQGCEARGICIMKGSIGKDHIHMLISCPPSIAPSKILQYLKGRSSRLIQDEFPELKKRYWGQHLWAPGYFCGTVGAVTEEMIKQYKENQGKEDIKEIFQITDEFESET